MAEGSEDAPRIIRGALNTRMTTLDAVGSGTWTAPSSLAVGTYIKVTYSGGGGGGGGISLSGSDGEDTLFEGLTDAPGGIQGSSGKNDTGNSVSALDGLPAGAIGGMGGSSTTADPSGTNGSPGGERMDYIQITSTSQTFNYTVGDGGAGGGDGSKGASGYIIIEY